MSRTRTEMWGPKFLGPVSPNSLNTRKSGATYIYPPPHTHTHLSELIVKRLWKLSACECVAAMKVLSREPVPTLPRLAVSHVLQMKRYFLASGQSCTMILLTYLQQPTTCHHLPNANLCNTVMLTQKSHRKLHYFLINLHPCLNFIQLSTIELQDKIS